MNNDCTVERGVVHSLDRHYSSKAGKSRSFGKLQRSFVEVIEKVLREDLALFEGGEKIWLNQCDTTLSHLSIVITLIQNLCTVVDDSSGSPLMVPTSRSSNALLVKLHYADLQLCGLLDLITAFRSAGLGGPKRTGKKREEICHRLKLFMIHWNDLLQNIAIQEEHILKKFAQPTSSATVALSSPVLITCHSSSCQQQLPNKREWVDSLQRERTFPQYLKLVPIGSVETSHNLSQEAEQDTDEDPFCRSKD